MRAELTMIMTPSSRERPPNSETQLPIYLNRNLVHLKPIRNTLLFSGLFCMEECRVVRSSITGTLANSVAVSFERGIVVFIGSGSRLVLYGWLQTF